MDILLNCFRDGYFVELCFGVLSVLLLRGYCKISLDRISNFSMTEIGNLNRQGHLHSTVTLSIII